MSAVAKAFPSLPGAAGAAASCAGCVVAFQLFALAPGEGAAFAACALCLVFAAAVGPFLVAGADAAAALLRCAAVAACGAAVCAGLGAARGSAAFAAGLAGAFCGLYALALGALAQLGSLLLGHRPAALLASSLGLVLLATLFFWDGAFLRDAADRKASARRAVAWNAAAGAAVTLEFDWIHAKALYSGNETAESLAGVPREGLGGVSLRAGIVAVVAGGLARLLRRRPS
ncbi:MAG: hypothetical protein ACT4PV_01850 [Planctomycetaceae bacterium]